MCKRIIPDFESTSCGLGLHLNIGSQYALSVRATVVGIVADSGRFFAHVRGILAFEVDENDSAHQVVVYIDWLPRQRFFARSCAHLSLDNTFKPCQ